MTTIEDTGALRRAVIDGCRWMNARGLNQSTSGNISVRVEDAMLVTPSGVPYDDMAPGMLVRLPLSGEPAPGTNPSSEWRFHQRLLATRPDAAAVVHAHPPHCTVLSVQRREIPAVHYMVAAFGGDRVPLAPYALFGSEALADGVARAMARHHACLMANHGATVVGDTLDRALWRLEELETLARTYYLADPGGPPVLLGAEEIAEVAAGIAAYGRPRAG